MLQDQEMGAAEMDGYGKHDKDDDLSVKDL